MRNLSNLGLVEMTEQEMREVNGGFAWYWWAAMAIGAMVGLTDDSGHYHPGKCYCDQLQDGMCNSCLESLKY